MGSFVKHVAAVVRPNAGIYADMDYQETNEEEAGEGHYQLFPDEEVKNSDHFIPVLKIENQ